ncbi:MAG: RNA polymerase sigma factor [Alphaproteobacteria bacterium]|jgi:RNA polymerase sigma-70 factor (ECF subfamily)|nr:RNA polymerase sigma factor [Alphaproteobacteria bacterium]
MPCPGESDEALLARVAEGDEAACRVLVARHLGPIVAFAGRLLGDPAEAEDVAQDAFLALWRHAARWRPGGARLTTWLHKVAMNGAFDRLRRRRGAPLEAAGDPVDPAPGPAAALQAQDVARTVAAALGTLPERQRAALVLAHYQELSNIEAAAVMEVSVEALESLLSRGRRSLRQRLAAKMPDLLGEI